ncbi:5'-methylthioadenosine/S-adenosylhomocysteine nucleosidase [Planctomycetes bacterium CA13]|uniref:5'-methylthioadenosine/S-adenosylhomocysteine nucleosidase n=2 Tax=Novipirellula herctigrandis TaxID=2527986 RepID=A0A5C5Z4N9_9BACT|nr:5'-methylthioadenosine/S-adenosylhomocysteine nucleosidase [Planctomycetes bacterium CA13]
MISGAISNSSGIIELCGFGLVAAAARSAQLIAQHAPARVYLIGIAGSLSASCRIGSAYEFGQVRCDGIGVGVGQNHRPASELGWKHFGDIDDSLALESTSSLRLVSVCAASAAFADAHRRGNADAEDMEGYAVALACKLVHTPVVILRGISNQAGDRDHSRWQIEHSLRAAAELFLQTQRVSE